MTPPAPQPRPAAPYSLSRILIVVAAGLLVLAAFAAGGEMVGTVPAWSWAFGGAAAFILSWAVP